MTNVKPYSDNHLLARIESIGGRIPKIDKYLIIAVQSQEDAYNLLDDKFYVFDGPKFRQLSSGTTNAGRTALNFLIIMNLMEQQRGKLIRGILISILEGIITYLEKEEE